MNQKTYTSDELDKFQYIRRERYGPYTLDEWLEYIEFSDNIPDDFKSMDTILIKYPKFYSICKFVYLYKKPNGTKLSKVEYEINERVVSSSNGGKYKVKPPPIFNPTDFPKCDTESYNTDRSNLNTNDDKNRINASTDSLTDADISIKSGSSFKLFKGSSIRSKMQNHCIIDNISKEEPVKIPYRRDVKEPYNKRTLEQKTRLPRQPRKALYSLVVKNIPNDMDIQDIHDDLLYLFSNYTFDNKLHVDPQNVCKVNILKTPNGQSRGLAFVDFYYKDSLDKIFSSGERFKLGFNILELEKKKSR